jgi:probable rRNA maturation factor
MKLDIRIDDTDWKSIPNLRKLAKTAISAAVPNRNISVSLLFTSDAKIAEMNGQWRAKPYATNVLSFPIAADAPVPDGEPQPLGDIVLAFGVISKEALEQKKPVANHASHLIVHGVLHLLGYDHENDQGAEAMERLETKILAGLGIDNPYAT